MTAQRQTLLMRTPLWWPLVAGARTSGRSRASAGVSEAMVPEPAEVL